MATVEQIQLLPGYVAPVGTNNLSMQTVVNLKVKVKRKRRQSQAMRRMQQASFGAHTPDSPNQIRFKLPGYAGTASVLHCGAPSAAEAEADDSSGAQQNKGRKKGPKKKASKETKGSTSAPSTPSEDEVSRRRMSLTHQASMKALKEADAASPARVAATDADSEAILGCSNGGSVGFVIIDADKLDLRGIGERPRDTGCMAVFVGHGPSAAAATDTCRHEFSTFWRKADREQRAQKQKPNGSLIEAIAKRSFQLMHEALLLRLGKRSLGARSGASALLLVLPNGEHKSCLAIHAGDVGLIAGPGKCAVSRSLQCDRPVDALGAAPAIFTTEAANNEEVRTAVQEQIDSCQVLVRPHQVCGQDDMVRAMLNGCHIWRIDDVPTARPRLFTAPPCNLARTAGVLGHVAARGLGFPGLMEKGAILSEPTVTVLPLRAVKGKTLVVASGTVFFAASPDRGAPATVAEDDHTAARSVMRCMWAAAEASSAGGRAAGGGKNSAGSVARAAQTWWQEAASATVMETGEQRAIDEARREADLLVVTLKTASA